MPGKPFPNKIIIHIKEKSFLAFIAAKWMKANRVAVVVDNRIHLHGCNKQQFLANTTWLNHELQHVYQYQQLGTLTFLAKYIFYSFKYGYFNNPFEVDARNHETKRAAIFDDVRIK